MSKLLNLWPRRASNLACAGNRRLIRDDVQSWNLIQQSPQPIRLGGSFTPLSVQPVTKGAHRIVLGISGAHHDSSAVLLRDGQLVAGLEEERMTRAKHDNSPFPVNATLRLLSTTGLRWEDIDAIAVGWNYNRYASSAHRISSAARFFERLDMTYARLRGIHPSNVRRRDVPERSFARFRMEVVNDFLQTMSVEAGSSHRPPVIFVRHHLAHAASAWYASGFEDPTLVVAIDGYGETETTTVWLGKGKDLRLLASIPLPDSLGWVYSSITEYLGFQPLNSEGEVMGLAPYGVPRNLEEAELGTRLREFMNEFVRLLPRGRFRVNPEYTYFGDFPPGCTRVTQALIDRLKNLVPPATKPNRKINPDLASDRKYAILAWALQERTEETIVHIVRHFLLEDWRTRGARAVALAGGVAFNINANSRLIAEGLVTPGRLFVQPAAGDSGAALGAAMIAARDVYGFNPHCRMRRVDLGPGYADSEIREALDSHALSPGTDYEFLEDEEAIISRVSEMLAAHQVVAWFQGRSEFGPRALGNRSILLNPADPRANKIANIVKCRENWRPLAISIAAGDASRFLEGLQPGTEAPFMNTAFGVRTEKLEAIASGRHPASDDSRPQTVALDQNPLLSKLLLRLGRLTGTPAVVNTSFNRREPLVESPEEALNTFAYMSGVDALILGRYLVTLRHRIKVTIPSLCEEPCTRVLLAWATQTGSMNQWKEILARVRVICPRARAITAVFRDRRGRTRVCEWALVKEFFAGEISPAIRACLCRSICDETFHFGAAEVFVGVNNSKYDRVVFDVLRKALTESLKRVVEFGHSSEAITLGRLSDAPDVRLNVRQAGEEEALCSGN